MTAIAAHVHQYQLPPILIQKAKQHNLYNREHNTTVLTWHPRLLSEGTSNNSTVPAQGKGTDPAQHCPLMLPITALSHCAVTGRMLCSACSCQHPQMRAPMPPCPALGCLETGGTRAWQMSHCHCQFLHFSCLRRKAEKKYSQEPEVWLEGLWRPAETV